MPLDYVNNGDAGSTARATINTAIDQINTNTTALTNKQPLDADLTAIAALSPSNGDMIYRDAGVWKTGGASTIKTDLSLNNVDNTSDANKPVSTAQQTALNLKQDADAADTTLWRITSVGDSDYTLAVGDNKKILIFNVSIGRTLTIPLNATEAFDIGTHINVANLASSATSISLSAAGGVTLNIINGVSTTVAKQTGVHLYKTDIDTWLAQF